MEILCLEDPGSLLVEESDSAVGKIRRSCFERNICERVPYGTPREIASPVLCVARDRKRSTFSITNIFARE